MRTAVTTEVTPPLVRWRCPACGEECVAQEAEWVEHARSTHHCPTAEQINRALKGLYDG